MGQKGYRGNQEVLGASRQCRGLLGVSGGVGVSGVYGELAETVGT